MAGTINTISAKTNNSEYTIKIGNDHLFDNVDYIEKQNYDKKAIIVSAKVYNLQGQEITTLVDKELAAGSHQILWDGKDSCGNNMVSGLYFYRVAFGEIVQANKCILVR